MIYRVEPRNPESVHAPAPVEFTTAAGLLHWAIKARVFDQRYINDKPRDFTELHMWEHRGRISPGLDPFCGYRITPDHMAAMLRAFTRASEIVYYLREVEPEWVEGEEVHYMDNSVERIDTNKYGGTRRVMVKQPSGDACF